METEMIRRNVSDPGHEIFDPSLTGPIVRATGADEPFSFVLAERDHLATPQIGGVLGRDAGALGFVEVVDDGFSRIQDVLPVLARELRFKANHRPEWSTMFEFGGIPGVPVGDGDERTIEVDLVHHLGAVLGVCPIQKQTALLMTILKAFQIYRDIEIGRNGLQIDCI